MNGPRKMTIEDLLAEIAERNWLLNNLFQLSDGSWQANLRSDTHYTDWGRGSTPQEALSRAINNLSITYKFEDRPVISTIEARASFSDIAARLTKPAVKINRRI